MDSNWEQWFSKQFENQETQLFTNALQFSFSDYSNPIPSSSSPSLDTSSLPYTASHTATSSSSRRSSMGSPPLLSKKIVKPQPTKKSRAIKERMTTTLTVSAENFKEIVQKMTGPVGSELVRPQAKRAGMSGSVGPAAVAEVFVEDSLTGFNVDEFLDFNFPILESFTGLGS